MVRRTTQAALESLASEVIVVTGFQRKAVEAALAGLQSRSVHNPSYRDGLSTSVRAGLGAISESSAAALFLPCDQPYMDSSTLDALIREYRGGAGKVLIPAFRGRRGAPVLFDRLYFDELGAVLGDEGGRQVLKRHPDAVVEVELDEEAPLSDFDTLEELEALLP